MSNLKVSAAQSLLNAGCVKVEQLSLNDNNLFHQKFSSRVTAAFFVSILAFLESLNHASRAVFKLPFAAIEITKTAWYSASRVHYIKTTHELDTLKAHAYFSCLLLFAATVTPIAGAYNPQSVVERYRRYALIPKREHPISIEIKKLWFQVKKRFPRATSFAEQYSHEILGVAALSLALYAYSRNSSIPTTKVEESNPRNTKRVNTGDVQNGKNKDSDEVIRVAENILGSGSKNRIDHRQFQEGNGTARDEKKSLDGCVRTVNAWFNSRIFKPLKEHQLEIGGVLFVSFLLLFERATSIWIRSQNDEDSQGDSQKLDANEQNLGDGASVSIKTISLGHETNGEVSEKIVEEISSKNPIEKGVLGKLKGVASVSIKTVSSGYETNGNVSEKIVEEISSKNPIGKDVNSEVQQDAMSKRLIEMAPSNNEAKMTSSKKFIETQTKEKDDIETDSKNPITKMTQSHVTFKEALEKEDKLKREEEQLSIDEDELNRVFAQNQKSGLLRTTRSFKNRTASQGGFNRSQKNSPTLSAWKQDSPNSPKFSPKKNSPKLKRQCSRNHITSNELSQLGLVGSPNGRKSPNISHDDSKCRPKVIANGRQRLIKTKSSGVINRVKNSEVQFSDVLQEYGLKDNLSDQEIQQIFYYVKLNQEKWIEELKIIDKTVSKGNETNGIFKRVKETGLARTLFITKSQVLVCFKKKKDPKKLMIVDEKKGSGSYKSFYIAVECNPVLETPPVVVGLPTTKLGNDLNIIVACKKELEAHYEANRHNLKGVVKLHGHIYYINKGVRKNMMLMEFCKNGELADYTTDDPEKQLSSKNKGHIALTLIQTIHDLHHKAKLIHRDLKPENIFLDGHFNPKLGDFGLSTLTNKVDSEVCGTPQYMAPEIWKNMSRLQKGIPKEKCTAVVDVFSLATLLIDLKGFLPFWIEYYHTAKSVEISLPKTIRKLNFSKHEEWKAYFSNADQPGSVDNIVYNMFNPDPEKRWTIDDICKAIDKQKNAKEQWEKWFDESLEDR